MRKRNYISTSRAVREAKKLEWRGENREILMYPSSEGCSALLFAAIASAVLTAVFMFFNLNEIAVIPVVLGIFSIVVWAYLKTVIVIVNDKYIIYRCFFLTVRKVSWDRVKEYRLKKWADHDDLYSDHSESYSITLYVKGGLPLFIENEFSGFKALKKMISEKKIKKKRKTPRRK